MLSLRKATFQGLLMSTLDIEQMEKICNNKNLSVDELDSILQSITATLDQNKDLNSKNKHTIIKLFQVLEKLLMRTFRSLETEKINLVKVFHKEVTITIKWLSNSCMQLRSSLPIDSQNQFDLFVFQISNKLASLDHLIQKTVDFHIMLEKYSKYRNEIHSLFGNILKLPLKHTRPIKEMDACVMGLLFDDYIKTFVSWEKQEQIHNQLYKTYMSYGVLQEIPRH